MMLVLNVLEVRIINVQLVVEDYYNIQVNVIQFVQ